ncbi:MAG: imidazole glycerol phosphate synthase subunit HisH [Alphaproteobacteria bacterium]|jgi:imidazole glycerol-phosphate synthase subunit HisH|nr:imidazole glycerol phosphate synthase subunit HisH [Alphaproteobacteria bacterium]MBT5160103.1 imidazole glycerol phosphate synthase subunit HisH [Alphaproteobacteria bacterium]MBT5918248.1 imidazole glycerol phosphate synthase subunit HisH [Alphaproteobacteria bacterium]MBT6387210.1 imidazole glycerol phosphate synthase subunit HisH [Alphaproteobacteria bacterium]
MTVAIIDYGSGNLRSAAKAFERMVRETGRSDDILVTSDADVVRQSDHIVLPGVGAFADCRRGLYAVDGMVDALQHVVVDKGQPFLGICVGMQLMATVGREHGEHAGLDWIKGDIVPLSPADASLKVPHMGWNDLQIKENQHPVLSGIDTGDHVYFVHSYHLRTEDPAHILATVDYGEAVTAIVGRDNLIGTQFHPEKSQQVGLHLIANFLNWKP